MEEEIASDISFKTPLSLNLQKIIAAINYEFTLMALICRL